MATDEFSTKEMYMINATIVKIQVLALVATLAWYAPATLAQKSKSAGKSQTAAAAPDAAQKSPCGNQTLCYDTADFTATIAQFRTSTDGSGNKMLDAIVHFQNKTGQVLSLGYADGSAEGMDDHGNRYELNKNGVRGMGVIAGTTPDAKFVLQPSGTGDARFELLWNAKDQIAGATYELDLSIREMNQGDDKKWALGNETLLHYDGLANGSASAASPGKTPGGAASSSGETPASASGVVPGAPATSTGSSLMSNLNNGVAAATQPCGTASSKAAGAANSTGQSGAADAVSSTTSAISSISSLFGHKKAAAAPAVATTAASASPCASPTNAVAGGGAKGTPTPKANAITQQPPAVDPVAATPAAAAAPVAAAPPAATAPTTPASRTGARPAAGRQPGVVNALLKQPATPTPAPKAPTVAPKAPGAAPVPAPAPAAKKPAAVPAPKKPMPATSPATTTGAPQ
jgi:hypothetical protein